MMKKIPVQITPLKRTRYAFQRLRVCRSCHNFTVLWEKECMHCGKSAFIPVEHMAVRLTKRSMQTERLVALFLTLAGVLFSSTFQEIAICLGGGLALTVLLWIVQRQMVQTESPRKLSKWFNQEQDRLIQGLRLNIEAAVGIRPDNERLAYEMLREIGTLVDSDRNRLQQLSLLRSFILRRDMDLQLESLLLFHFDEGLAEYIGEIAKIKPELIKERTLLYVLDHEAEFLSMPGGKEILAATVGAIVRMKRYVTLYPEFIRRYARLLPKDRFLRLFRIVTTDPHLQFSNLAVEVAEIYNSKYQWDPDFQNTDKKLGHNV
ncbi:hypothetical protein [Paenibacillus sp. J22TS3]|uniref:hypothetical protein n=1 Tax=Paenibacillus sp. J22TS3 TaxID=2807192 RepID=UPI001BCBCC04|nr:hypothetical protein [Paenibacillus sp. J22TS3]